MRARTTALSDGITAIDTEYARPQQDASHLIVEQGRAAFVDTGVNASVPLLLDALEARQVDVGDVDYVFLTHVHLDHAGGAGLLMESLPNARLIVHPRGARHMVDPTRLVAGTEAVYGRERTRELYGEIRPVERLAAEMHAGIDAFVAIARRHASLPDRNRRLEAALFEYFIERLDEHGYTGDRDSAWRILDIDVRLNAQGLEVWLDREAGTTAAG